jgi:ABC-type uncharacterized transport system involved in gliding motility auxiliary subunit
MKLGWLKARRTKYTGYISLYILIVVGVLAAVNWLAQSYNKSYDSTANKRFSLADQTEKVVRSLKQDVKITYYDETARFDQARDLLGRYAALSRRLEVVYVDPLRKPQIAKAAGVSVIPSTYVEAGSRKEEARSLTETEITSALIRALKGQRTVCAVSGSGEPDLDDNDPNGYNFLKQLLEKDNYKTRTITLLEQPQIPADCTELLVGGPRKDYSEDAVKAIQGYVEGGGRALFLLGPPLKLGREVVSENQGLLKTLEGWGVTVAKNLILDARGQRSGLGADVAVVTDYESHTIGRAMKKTGTVFPFSRSLEVKSVDKAQVEKLFSTGSNSYATASLGPGPIRVDANKDKKGPFAIAAAGTYDTGKENLKGRFVVVGSADWATNNFLGIPFFGNSDLVLNMANWLSADEELISIRPKSQEDRRLTLNVQNMWVIKYLSVFLIPLAAIGAGVVVWWRRR